MATSNLCLYPIKQYFLVSRKKEEVVKGVRVRYY